MSAERAEGELPATRSHAPAQQMETPALSETQGVVPPEQVHVPGYEVQQVLGRGGMGVIYLARQQQLNRLVALKMILAGGHAGPDEILRFLSEAEAVAALQHPNIVQVHEVSKAL